eukprot:12736014-Prorocentrum_lima.AAC.1
MVLEDVGQDVEKGCCLPTCQARQKGAGDQKIINASRKRATKMSRRDGRRGGNRRGGHKVKALTKTKSKKQMTVWASERLVAYVMIPNGGIVIICRQAT